MLDKRFISRNNIFILLILQQLPIADDLHWNIMNMLKVKDVVHNDNGMGGIVLPDIIGKTMVSKGVNTNVTIELDASMTYTPGQLLFPMLHLDNGQIGVYEFDGNSQFDGPEIFGNDAFPGNVIFTSFTVLNVN